MEKSLFEKLKNGTCDDIDKDMIVSRVKRAVKDVVSATAEYTNKLKELGEQYSDEMKLGGFAVVLYVTDITEDDDEIGTKVVLGRNDKIEKLVREIRKEVRES